MLARPRRTPRRLRLLAEQELFATATSSDPEATGQTLRIGVVAEGAGRRRLGDVGAVTASHVPRRLRRTRLEAAPSWAAPRSADALIELSVDLFEKQIGRAHSNGEIGKSLPHILESGERVGGGEVFAAFRIPRVNEFCAFLKLYSANSVGFDMARLPEAAASGAAFSGAIPDRKPFGSKRRSPSIRGDRAPAPRPPSTTLRPEAIVPP